MMSNDQQIKILIVDDTRTSRYIIKKMLTGKGYQTLEAEDGTSALEMVRAFQPDIVLMDLQMPDMSGLECSQRIKDSRNSHQTRIIMVTSEKRFEKMSEAYKVGCNDYITKPVAEDELLQKIKDVERYIRISRSIRDTQGTKSPY